MDPIITGIVALGSYLVGSFSFARTAVRLHAPGNNIENIQLPIPGTVKTTIYKSLGGSAAGIILGPKIGFLVGILDMLKVILPVLALRLIFNAQPYPLIATVGATIGHIWPIYYRFKGGGGYSTIFGGILVITPVGAVVCSLAGMILGLFVFRNFALLYALQFILLIPWMAVQFHEVIYVVFAVIVNILFFIPWIPSAIATLQAGKPDHQPTLREMMQPYPMGKGFIKIAEKIRFNID
jgi:acyl phosphate:glycerol-3-phosphate acyltransferase